MKKRILAIALIVLCLVSPLFAGGSKEEASSDGKIELRISWWGSNSRHEATLKALDLYMEKNPNLIVKMQVANTNELLTKIDEGEIDFAFVEGYFSKEEYDSLVYSKEEYIAVCGKDYVLQKEPCYLEELCSERILVRERGSGTREILERAMEEQNLSLKDFISVAEIGNLQTIKALVEHHLGITFLYRRAVLKELEQGSLREIQVRDFKVHHDFNCIWRKGSIFEEEYLEIFQQMKEVEKIRIS